MADIVVPVAVEVAKCLGAPVGRHCSYVIFCDRYVRQLNDEIEKLVATKDDVLISIDEARNNIKPIKPRVEEWVKDAEAGATKARNMLENEGRAEKTCFYGWLPNPKARYRLGNEASKMIKEIKGLIEQGQFKRVDDKIAPPGLVGGASDVNSSAGDGGDFITDSRASVFQGIMKALNDEKVKVVGVYGPGGVGKTTLMEEVEKKLRDEKILFHLIAKTKVLQNPNLKNIQDDIAYFLSLDLNDEKSPVGRADRLSKKLQSDPTKKILIILDDVWDKLDLKAVGIPLGNESRGCKLLLTSRDKDVLQQKMRASPIFHLKGLEDDEAFSLFEKTVGNRLQDDEELKEIAPQVVKKLAGLPLLINSVANTLKDSDVSAWRNALIKIDEKEKDTIVKLSYDHLKSEDAKSLFLLCGLIGGTIRVETLLILGMGLGLFEEFNKTTQDARDRLKTTLDKLRSACLLLDDGDDKEKVSIHDLYSEVVISTPFRGRNSLMMNSNYGSWPKEKLEKCWAICLADVDKDRLVELMTCQFPGLKILMLSQPKNWRWMPEHRHEVKGCSGLLDFTYMKELRVLYLQSMRITTFPSSIEILGNLQSLYLDHCNVEDVAILGNLEALQFLSFAGSEIWRLPKEIGKLTNLKLLNLSDCLVLKIIEPDVLKALTNLEELRMKGSRFDQWMGKDEISLEPYNVLAELESLKKLTALEISIDNPTILLEVGDLPSGNLIRFWINIGKVDGREFQGLRTMKLQLERCNSILSKEWVQKALQKTQHLHLDGLREFKKNAQELCIQGFPQLKHLDIWNSPSIKYIAGSSNGAFTILESLFLKNLINLEKICHGDITAECFSKLKAVIVKECNQLKYLWRLSQKQKLVQLEEIEVQKCDSMQAIVTIDSRKDIFYADYGVELPNVRRLYLAELRDMMSFCTGAGTTSEGAPIQISLPNLKDLKLNLVGSLKRIWHDELSKSSLCNLATITIENCFDILHIFPLTIIGRLHNLQSVEVINCPSLKSLFDFGSLDSNTEQIVVLLPELVSIDVETCPSLESLFNCGSLNSNAEHKIISLPKLEEVRVRRAKKLRHVVMSHSQIVLSFPSLEAIRVENCSDLRYLFSNYTATTLVKLERLEISKCERMKEVILEEEVGRSEAEVMSFPCLSELTLMDLDNLISFRSGSVKRQLGETAEEKDELPQSLFNEMVTFPNMRYLEIEGVPCKELWNNHVLADSIVCSHRFLLKRVQVINCQSLKSLFDFGSLDSNTEQTMVVLPELVSINVRTCPSLESMFNCGSLDSNVELKIIPLPKLEEVWVRQVKKLRHVVMSHSQIVLSFPSLKAIMVENCSDLRYLFPNYTATTLVKLERLEISKCERMKEVILEEEVGRSEAKVMSFPCLSELTLKELDNLISFGSGSVKRQLGEIVEENDELPQPLFNEMVTFPNMRNLVIEGVPCKELWNNHVPADSVVCSCRFLSQNVKVKNCSSLKSLFDFGSLDSNTEQTVVLLPELVSINVETCPSLESLFNCGSLNSNAEHKIISLPKLEEVRVSGAKKLRHVVMSHSQIVLSFPSLETVSVENCADLRYLFPNYTATTLVKLERLEISKCERMKEVILEEEVGRSEAKVMSFPCLSELTLKDLDNLISFGSGSVKRQLGEIAEEKDELPQSLFNEMVTFPNMRNLEIEGDPCKELWNNHVPVDSIVCSHRFLSENVKVKNYPSLKSLFDFGSLDSNIEQTVVLLPELVSINVETCPSLESLFNCGSLDSNEEHKIISLPKLEEVRVSEAKKLRHVVMSHSQIVLGFPSLKTVSVKNCFDLRYLFPNYTATTLVKLERLEISKCERIKEVILEEEVGRSKAEVISFPCLSKLILHELDNFGAFISSPTSVKRQLGKTAEHKDELQQPLFNEMLTFPNITSLEIDGLRCKELWNNQIPTDSFQKLKSLKLKNCDNHERIATSYMWKNLRCCLEKLEVISCHSIEIIYEGDGTDTKSGKLRRLVLSDLENLRCIWQSDGLPNLPFPNLRDVKVVKCSRLETLFTTFTAKLFGQIEKLVVESCEDMELIAGHEKGEEATGTTITFSKLTKLSLFKLPKFRRFFLPEKYTLKFPCSEDFPSLQMFLINSCGAEPDQYYHDWSDDEVENTEVFLQYFIALDWLSVPLNRKLVYIS